MWMRRTRQSTKGNRMVSDKREKRRECDDRRVTATSVNAMEKLVAMTVSGASVTRRTPTTIAGVAATTIAAMTDKEGRKQQAACKQLRERRQRDGSCSYCRNNDNDGSYCDNRDCHHQ